MTAMPEFRCVACGTYHEPPKCSWSCDAPCATCGNRMGFAGYGQPRDGVCNACWLRAEGLVG